MLVTLIYAIIRAYQGYTADKTFSKTDNSIRHWTATIAHIQLVLGFTLYLNSPVVRAFLTSFRTGSLSMATAFFGIIHFLCMLVAIVLITVGSALAKRKPTNREKFRTMLIWFSLALLLIFLAIPWPFSPLAHRPYLRPFTS